jgi:hypothetical protein
MSASSGMFGTEFGVQREYQLPLFRGFEIFQQKFCGFMIGFSHSRFRFLNSSLKRNAWQNLVTGVLNERVCQQGLLMGH